MSDDPVRNFLARVQQATQIGSRDIRLTIREGSELGAVLVKMLAQNAAKKTLTQSSDTTKMDGGSFK